MKGYHPPRVSPDTDEPREHAERPVHIPRGSSTSSRRRCRRLFLEQPAGIVADPVAAAIPAGADHHLGDRVTNAIHDYPLQEGIGNNPTDMQSFIRQRANQ